MTTRSKLGLMLVSVECHGDAADSTTDNCSFSL